MSAKQIFGTIILTGLLVMLLLFILTSQMISASVMVQQVSQTPSAIPTVAQAVQQNNQWYIDFDANNWRYRISNRQWNDELQPWQSCDDGLPTLPESVAWQVNEFCKKYVFTPLGEESR